MAEKGFAIRCPHCRKWNIWEDVHPEEVAIDSKEELKQILRKLELSSLSGKTESFSHDKLLRCESTRWLCPASFEAFVCRNERDAYDCLEAAEAWSFKRDYRLYKKDCKRRWENKEEGKYYGILFNTQPISRRTEIELEQLVDRELLSRWISGVAREIGEPFTVFSASVFKPKRGERTAYWMPIELYSMGKAMVPETFNKFCMCCRNIIVRRLVEKFESEKFSVWNCPINYGENGKCAGKDPACIKEPKDWRRCPAFRRERWKCLCTSSDLELIWEIEDKWKLGESLEQGIRHRCPAGFLEIGFPIVAHNHVVGIGMTGQLFLDEGEIKEVDDLVGEWSILKGSEKKLKRARQKLIDEERTLAKRGESKFLVSERRVNRIIDKLNKNIGRISEIANSRYRDFRLRSESDFREEMLGFIQNHKMERDFFYKRVTHVLERMRVFWAFDAAYLAGYSLETKDISVIGFSHKYKRPKAFGIPGKKKGKADVKDYQRHPCPYLHQSGKAIPRSNRLLQDLLSIFENAIQDRELEVPEGKYYFFVLVPLLEEVYVFVFAVRDEAAVASLKQLVEGGVSDLCQDEILETCTEVIYEFGNIWYSQANERAWREFSALASHRIGNEISTVGMLINVLGGQLMADPEWSRKWGDKLSIMEECIKRAKKMLTDQANLTANIKPNPRRTNLESLIMRAATGVLPSTATLSFESSAEQKEIMVDPDMMEQVFKELCVNAVRAGGEAVQITTEVATSPSGLSIFFRDNGPGIPEDQIEQLFEPFVRFEEGRRGLGLATVRSIVEAHGGSITLGKSNSGTKFIIRLPLAGGNKWAKPKSR